MSARLGWAGLAVAIIGVLVALGAWFYPVEVTREPVSTPGNNPFMPPVGTDQPGGVTSPPNTGRTFAGGTPGLYGGTRNSAVCDPKQMVEFLQQNEDKAKAWADVLGIKPEGIPDYVAGLTPAILRSDTFVTNHGFVNGQITTIPAILQAGTAVLVDSHGVPVTKCYCGNPLTGPVARPRRNYVGTTWPTFSPTQVTVIQPTTETITAFTLVNPETNEVFDRPRGTAGENDQNAQVQPPSPIANVSVTVTAVRDSYTGSCPPPASEAPYFRAVIRVSAGPTTIVYRWRGTNGGSSDPHRKTINFPGTGPQEQTIYHNETSYLPNATKSEWMAVDILSPIRLQSNRVDFTRTCS